MNSYFGYAVVEKLKLVSFDNSLNKLNKDNTNKIDAANSKFMNKLVDIKNEKIKKSLLELTKLFKQK